MTDRESKICPVCSDRSRLENHFDDIYLYRCPECDHCFTDIGALESHVTYEQTYYDDDHGNWNKHPNYPLFDFIIDSIEKHAHTTGPLSILDIGCGEGHFLQRARERNPSWDLNGIDFLPRSLGNGIKYTAGDLFGIDFDRRFDAVVNLQVIEHIGDLRGFTGRLHQVTAPGGLLFVGTIHDRNPIYRMARTLNRVGYGVPLERIYSRHHLNHFNVSSLRRLMTNSGFEVLTTHRHGMPLRAVDYPDASPIVVGMFKAFISLTFATASLFDLALLQTIVCRNKTA